MTLSQPEGHRSRQGQVSRVERGPVARRLAFLLAALWPLVGTSAAWALDPSLDISQDGHRAWRNLDGFGLGTIVAIAQTTDGYIWFGTPDGLLRFDGVRSFLWRAPAGTP